MFHFDSDSDASQLGSDVVSKLCDLMQKCSVGIQRQEPSATQNKGKYIKEPKWSKYKVGIIVWLNLA